MLTQERHSLIRRRLEAAGRVVAGDLAREFDVSEDTIRRDLRELAAAGLCERVYGGALLREPARPFVERLGEKRSIKARFAAEIVSRLPAGGLVFIDAGSTNLAVAEAVRGGRDITVMTNAPAIAAQLTVAGDVPVIMTGGRVEPALGGAVDARALAAIEGVYPDLFVLGTCGVVAEEGMFASQAEEQHFKSTVAAHSRHVITAADAAKFIASAPYRIAAFSPAVTLLVEAGCSAPLEAIAEAGADIIEVAGMPAGGPT
jgi:DeoR/GlpR family transcriptional regulator of sugar metabolism